MLPTALSEVELEWHRSGEGRKGIMKVQTGAKSSYSSSFKVARQIEWEGNDVVVSFTIEESPEINGRVIMGGVKQGQLERVKDIDYEGALSFKRSNKDFVFRLLDVKQWHSFTVDLLLEKGEERWVTAFEPIID